MNDTPPTRPASRPLSEISENEDIRRVGARVSSYSLKALASTGDRVVSSRPGSEVREDAKRISMPVHTITLNLADYTGSPVSTPKLVAAPAALVVTAPTPTPTLIQATATATGPLSPSPSPSPTLPPSTTQPTKRKSLPPAIAEKPVELSGRPVAPFKTELVVDLSEPSEGISPLFMATRASLRPSLTGPLPIKIDYNDNKSPSPSPSLTSLDSPRSSIELSKSLKASKTPKWMKRSSMTPVLRSKSRSPAASPVDLPEPGSPHYSSSLPPRLPPRKFPSGPLDNNSPAAGGPSRAPPPPAHPARETVASHHSTSQGHGRTRWGMGGGHTVVRSSSSNSIASTASAAHQRLPTSAQRVLGHAGHAVSKTWLRARGVGGSMSISALGQLRGEAEPTSPGPLSRKLSRDNVTPPPGEPSAWGAGVVKRAARNGHPRGLVFGRQLDITGRTWGVYDAADDREAEEDYCQRRRRCLPAVAVRCVDYLTHWGPQEEGVFRISGRSSHINRIRYEFDSGADLDLSLCDPADLDPHAVTSVFKSYIRELPEPILPTFVEHKLDDFLYKHRGKANEDNHVDDLATLISTLSSASWFLLADIISLIDLIPRHAAVNRMTHNALMISLGPTLRLSGEHVALLVRHRERIFDNPPLVSAADLIDFGSDDEMITLSPAFEDTPLPAPVMIPVATGPKPRPMSRISKKPSFGNLLGAARGGSAMRRSQSEQALSVSPVPPRLALPDRPVVEMPVFNNGTPDDIQETPEELELADPNPADVKSTDAMEESHYAPGTVAARARVYSTPTPIADRFRRTSTLHDLRPHAESIASSASSAVSIASNQSGGVGGDQLPPPPNPMVGLRRSPPLFFQSTNSIQPAVTHSSPTSKVVGTKRKDDAGTGEAPGGAKRLSSGPGPED